MCEPQIQHFLCLPSWDRKQSGLWDQRPAAIPYQGLGRGRAVAQSYLALHGEGKCLFKHAAKKKKEEERQRIYVATTPNRQQFWSCWVEIGGTVASDGVCPCVSLVKATTSSGTAVWRHTYRIRTEVYLWAGGKTSSNNPDGVVYIDPRFLFVWQFPQINRSASSFLSKWHQVSVISRVKVHLSASSA